MSMTILYCLIAFLSGVILAWLIKKQTSKNKFIDIETLKANAALEAEKNVIIN